MNYTKIPLSKIKPNPNNPRIIRDDKFKKLVDSIQKFPRMLEIRPIVVNNDMVILGGNMRLRACKEAGLKEVPVIKADDLTPDQQREFIIKDNVGFGEWDWAMLANEWDTKELTEWGLDVPGFNVDPDKMGNEFSLPDGDKEPFRQMTFTLADEQAVLVENLISEIKKTEEYKYVETFGNQNTNGNALYLLLSKVNV